MEFGHITNEDQMKKSIILMIAAMMIISITSALYADRLYLKSNITLEGKILSVKEATIEFDPVGDKPFEVIGRGEVRYIEYSDGTVINLEQYEQEAAKPSAPVNSLSPTATENPLEPGTFILGLGNVASFNMYSGELFKGSKNDFYINPGLSFELQYVILKGLAVGGTFGFAFFHQDECISIPYSITTITSSKNIVVDGGPSIAYFYQVSPHLMPFGEFTFTYGRAQVTYTDDYYDNEIITYNINRYSFNFSLGITYLFNNTFGLYAAYTYNRQMQNIEKGKISGSASDEIFIFYDYYEGKKIWGNINSLEIGFRIFL
ncbi:MAG: hypothetical protein CVV44_12280 [Spirochaetae bacterium HGW-Spirochaetae-1]|nr:MAG: hypothetical protein CVV44_12280 [Spirochaetae bacterium HGW-Spirochaetae-1]